MNLIPRRSLFDFDNMFENFYSPARWSSELSGGFFTPRVDIKETKDHYEITADLPGVRKDDLSVTLQNGVMTIEAESRQEEKRETEGKILRQERVYGRYVRSFDLGEGVNEKDIDASFKDGVLTLKAPRKKAVIPKSHRVQVH